MKIKEKYKMFNHARREYSRIFDKDYDFTQMSYSELLGLLKSSKQVDYTEYWYCCHGLYSNCWQDPFSEGVWGLTQAGVNALLAEVLKETRKYLKNKYRVLYCKSDDLTHVILITRDVQLCDYIITFTNNE